ncbi:MAG TPA: thiamine pyrophosphate-dependent enzyme [Kofleriaceae bacterium]|jgi:pyruvate dehydrogenase E1 component alpha subunit/2-oxoisovalerate dehydrogenase E1 component alpha subunit|nr:thiamine pyrophosphate-dependent enzyme [Kofleriaceae bacterium]
MAQVVSAHGVEAYFEGDDAEKARGLFQLIREDGTPVDEAAITDLDRTLARRMFEGMVRIRVTDARMMALQRQGRIGFYGEALGQEASVIGSAAASEPQDWIVPALREAGVGLYRGMTLDSYIAQIFGNAADPSKGRQLPCHPCDRAHHYVVMSSCISTQIPHAVGIAMAMKIAGDRDKVCFGYMGDGGTSEGDFHVALNFAGVSKAPCVLICQNNQWAISTPGHIQTAAESIARKAAGYGIEALRADGNDVLAVHRVVKRAADKARRGDGPTFIELLTYRVSAHTSSDDPSRYRDESVTEVWRGERDPLRRFETYLTRRGWLAAGEREAIAQQIEAEVRDAIARQEAVAPPALETLIDDVYEEPTWLLREQFAGLAAAPRARMPHQH